MPALSAESLPCDEASLERVAAPSPTQHPPAAEPAGTQTGRPRFVPLPRSGPQLPVHFEVDRNTLVSHPGRPLDPEAPVFVPRLVVGTLADAVDACPDALDEILAAVNLDTEPVVREEPLPGPCSCHQLPRGSCPAFIDRFVSTVVEVMAHGKPNMDGARRIIGDTQIDYRPWENLLGSYFDKRALVDALKYGWDFSLADNPDPKDSKANLPSAYEFPEHVEEYLRVELCHGALVGPLPSQLPFRLFRSPLGSVPKPRCPDKRRTITDCSQRGEGINGWIRHDFHRGQQVETHLPGTEQIVAAIKRTRLRFPGQEVQIFKADFSRYYRQFLCCPSQSPFLCVSWKGEDYADRAWSFGNRGACMASQRFSEGVAWVFRTQVAPAPGIPNPGRACRCQTRCQCGSNECEPYIDDSVGVCPEKNAKWLFMAFIELVEGLTLRLSTTPGHISPPSVQCVALGVLYDTRQNTVSLPEDKLVDLKAMLAVWSTKRVASPRDLASLAGRLLWACQCIPPGRLFLGRVLALKRTADARPPSQARRPIGLDEEFRLDLVWWRKMLLPWNGRCILDPHLTAALSLDASSNGWSDDGPGIGCYLFATSQYIATGVPEAMREWTIADLELFAHLLAFRAWGRNWASHQLNVLTDNEATRFLLQNGRSRDSRRLAIARELVDLQFKGDFRFHSSRISTTDNLVADSLSRIGQPGKWQSFLDFCTLHGVAPARTQVRAEWFQLGNSG